MPRISQGTAGVELDTGIATIGGNELKIVSTPTGLYKIEARGGGAPPKLTEETFTNIEFAKRALARYEKQVSPVKRKKEAMQAGIERRQAAVELKNGELESTVNNAKGRDD